MSQVILAAVSVLLLACVLSLSQLSAFQQQINRKWGGMSCCYGFVACRADCGIAWVVEEVGHFPENFKILILSNF